MLNRIWKIGKIVVWPSSDISNAENVTLTLLILILSGIKGKN